MIARNVNVNLFRQVRMWALFGNKCAVSRPRTTSVFFCLPLLFKCCSTGCAIVRVYGIDACLVALNGMFGVYLV